MIVGGYAASASAIIVQCNNCLPDGAFATAANQTLGEVVIVDNAKHLITRYYNRMERGRKIVQFVDSPSDLKNWYFGFIGDVVALSDSNGQVLIETGPGYSSNNSLMRRDPFANYDNWNAYNVITSPSGRQQLGESLADSLRPSIPGVSESLAQAMVSAGTGYAGTTLVFRIHWRDGSTSMFTYTGASPFAAYKDGSSTDKNKNPIVDSAVGGVNAGSIYVGTYQFQSNADKQVWVSSAALYGVTVGGVTGVGTVVVCNLQSTEGPVRIVCNGR
ncbi:hypothetical protein [Pseudoxanthomonas winnipegensis]|uniref:Uncharacterized protein n=1 Tax=Pseudoxanthomonas winnipegensis TaxID=2480810 RepID=A0A4Q8M057_9GAMM|nr:hypothetical protein [Pseudoxanthomonas winnipegensis]TAA38475.1 hypothetical protein EA655_16410 [Pseudoxanthomonas winnipegensis]